MTGHDPYRSRDLLRVPPLGEREATGELSIVAYVDRYPPFVNAGAEWMLHAMLRDLVERGHKVSVATNIDHRADVDGVQVWPAHWVDRVAVGADVIVGHLLWTRQVTALASALRRPLVYLLHNDFTIKQWALRTGDVTAVVYNSQWLEAAHAGRWGGPGVIVRPPCRVDDYKVDRAGAECVTLVNPNPDKGSQLFYELARRNPTRRWLAVGGAYGVQRKPKRGESVEFQPATGDIANDVYARTRVLLVPSRYESWGRVAVEAMCSGIPVIAHPTAGLREALGDAGIFVDRDNRRGWEEALTMLDDRAEYERASMAASARAAELDRIADDDLERWGTLIRRCAASGYDQPDKEASRP